jgi:hypothetical protein
MSDIDKLNFLTSCSKLKHILNRVEFSTQVDITKIQNLPYFNSFTNVLAKHIINDNFKLPNKIRHLTYNKCTGNLPVPKNLISLRWLTEQKINIDDISNNLHLLEIKGQKKHAKKIIKNLKNVKHLIIDGGNKISFNEYFPANVKRLDWNSNQDPELNNKWNLKYLSIGCHCHIYTIPISVETLEINNTNYFNLPYGEDPINKIKKLVFTSTNIIFFSTVSGRREFIYPEIEYNCPPYLGNCVVEELVFGKNFTKTITYIIPPSVTKCTFYGGYKGILPSTVKEVVILPL